MITIPFLYSKLLKKLRGCCILDSCVDKTAKIYSGTDFYHSTIGRHSYIGYDSQVINCRIGNFCSIGNRFISGGAEHPLSWASTSPVFQSNKGGVATRLAHADCRPTPRTIIGHDVWIGVRVTVKAGVTIGNGAVVGSGAVVTHDVPPYSIVAGCPATLIRYRFDDDTIAALTACAWWNCDDDVIRQAAYDIVSPMHYALNINNIARGGVNDALHLYRFSAVHNAGPLFHLWRAAA